MNQFERQTQQPAKTKLSAKGKKPFKNGMREIIKGKCYEVKVFFRPYPKAKRESKSETVWGTRTEARNRHRELKHELAKGNRIKSKKVTVAQYVKAYLRAVNVRPSTKQSIKRHLELYICKRFGERYLGDITSLEIKTLYADMRNGKFNGRKLSDNTVRLTHQYFKKALTEAEQDDYLVKNPTNDIKLAKPKTIKEIHPLTEDESARFLDAAEQSKWNLLFIVLLWTGLRLGEVVGIKWQDIDFANDILTVRRSVTKVSKVWHFNKPKNGFERSIKIPEFLTKMLLEAFRGKQNAYVFCNDKGEPANKRSLDRAFKRVLKRAGLPDIRVHDLRHTHATQLIKEGQPIKAVSERLGHSDINITLQIYVHVLPGMQDSIAKNLDETFLRIQQKRRDMSNQARK